MPANDTKTVAAFSALVIDDDESSAELMTMALNGAGVTDVQTTTDGQRAIRLLGTMARKPDLVVCDIYMPNMDAFQTLEELARTGYPGSIILMTGGDPQMLTLAHDVAEANALRVVGSLIKPIDARVVAELVRTVRIRTSA